MRMLDGGEAEVADEPQRGPAGRGDKAEDVRNEEEEEVEEEGQKRKRPR